MSEKLNWGALANTKVGDVEPPKGIPDGHYVGVFAGAGDVKERGKNNNLSIQYPVRLQEPTEDVDAEAFAASDGFSEKGYNYTFWITPDALFIFTEFGKALGASDELSVPELAEHIAQSGEPIVFEVVTGEGQNGRTFVNLNNAIPLSLWNEKAAA